MTIATIEMPVDELEQLQADLASARAEVARLRGPDPVAAEIARLAGEIEAARVERQRLISQVAQLREVNVQLGRAEAQIRQLERAVTVLVNERDDAAARAKETARQNATLRESNKRLSVKWQGFEEQARQRGIRADTLQRQLDDANAALIAASEDRLLAQNLSRALNNARRPNPTEEQP